MMDVLLFLGGGIRLLLARFKGKHGYRYNTSLLTVLLLDMLPWDRFKVYCTL